MKTVDSKIDFIFLFARVLNKIHSNFDFLLPLILLLTFLFTISRQKNKRKWTHIEEVAKQKKIVTTNIFRFFFCTRDKTNSEQL